jgi:hypothetical protein
MSGEVGALRVRNGAMDVMDVRLSHGELTGAHAEGEGQCRRRRRRPARVGVTASCTTFHTTTRPPLRYRHCSRLHVFPYELSWRASSTPTTRRVIFIGLLLGVCLGLLGVGSALSVLAAVPVLLAPLPVIGIVGWWFARRRLGAATLAVGFAFALALAQWPFAAWTVYKLPRGGMPGASFAVVLMVFVGLALAPVVIVVVRRRESGGAR